MISGHKQQDMTKPVSPPAPKPTVNTVNAANVAKPLVYIKLVLVALFFGGTFIAGRTIAPVVPLMTAATGRFAVAVALLLLVAWKVEGGLPRLSRSQLATTAALGFSGIFLYNLCFFAALSYMPAGRTALFVALNPIVTALALGLLFRERLGPVKWLGIGIAFFGTAIVITRGDPIDAFHDISRSIGLGEVLMFFGISSWAAYTIIGRYALRNLTPIAATTYAALWGLLFLGTGAAFEFSSVTWSEFGWQVWASIFYLGAFGTAIGFIWYYEGVKSIGASRTAVFNNLVPVFGVLLASILLKEPILISMVVGGALVIAGVTLTNR
jgi:drug/metabolite transporter (DMT)-like permease